MESKADVLKAIDDGAAAITATVVNNSWQSIKKNVFGEVFLKSAREWQHRRRPILRNSNTYRRRRHALGSGYEHRARAKLQAVVGGGIEIIGEGPLPDAGAEGMRC